MSYIRTNWQDRLDQVYGTGSRQLLKAELREDGETVVTNKCTRCGEVHTITSIQLRHKKGRIRKCISCQKNDTEKRKLDRQEAIEQDKRHNRKIIQLSLPLCSKCGRVVTKGHRVCETCKAENRNERYRKKEIARRTRIDNTICDKDISLKKLYERDNGVCYICGRLCDWSDSDWKNGAFIVGRNYPTIEHLKPLSKGGTHTWSNIKLACLSCNSKKYNREAV